MILLRVLWSIVSLLAFELINIPLMIIGWILIPLAAACKAYKLRKSKFYDNEILSFTWPFMYLWGNEEDGIANDTYKDLDSMFKKVIYWSAIRNPTNNMRFIPILSFILDPKKVKYIGNLSDINQYDTAIPQWFYAWHGLYSGFFWQFNFRGSLRRFWIGWKIYPTDINGVTPYRKFGVGFANQFKKID